MYVLPELLIAVPPAYRILNPFDSTSIVVDIDSSAPDVFERNHKYAPLYVSLAVSITTQSVPAEEVHLIIT